MGWVLKRRKCDFLESSREKYRWFHWGILTSISFIASPISKEPAGISTISAPSFSHLMLLGPIPAVIGMASSASPETITATLASSFTSPTLAVIILIPG